jgi:hypothetical protein
MKGGSVHLQSDPNPFYTYLCSYLHLKERQDLEMMCQLTATDIYMALFIFVEVKQVGINLVQPLDNSN